MASRDSNGEVIGTLSALISPSDASTALLRQSACICPDTSSLQRIGGLATKVKDWDDLIQRAEQHALAPLLFHHLKQSGVTVSKQAMAQLRALSIRHRHANRVRSRMLFEIAEVFNEADIECVILKGAALAWLIYPSPELRPMRDLDLLVPRSAALRAQRALAEMGFDAPFVHQKKTMRSHHHLPNASRYCDGLQVSVEVHVDAVSGDYPDSIRLGDLACPLQEVVVESGRFSALGHEDMLRHLCLHAFEPGSETRLICVADIIGYAKHFAAEIDWEHIKQKAPRITNTLSLLHYLTPLPAELETFRPPSSCSLPKDLGLGLVPISQMLAGRRSTHALLKQLMYPPEWWLRGYYGMSLSTPLSRIRWCNHLPRVGRWIYRRMRAVLTG